MGDLGRSCSLTAPGFFLGMLVSREGSLWPLPKSWLHSHLRETIPDPPWMNMPVPSFLCRLLAPLKRSSVKLLKEERRRKDQ